MSSDTDNLPAGTNSRRFLDQRRALVVQDARLAGLDHVVARRVDEVNWQLSLYFLTGPGKTAPVPSDLARRNLRLVDAASGARLRQPSLVGIGLAVDPSSGETNPAVLEVRLRFRDAGAAHAATSAGPVLLELVGLPEVDPFFSAGAFRFAAEPREENEETPAHSVGVELPELGLADTMARDYESLRTLMLNHMAARVPLWTERNPADLGIALIEILAYAGDYLSYFQDGVATEAYLQTARHRASVRRHARLVDYTLDEGANARVWVRIEIEGEGKLVLPRGTQLLSRSGELGAAVAAEDWFEEQALSAGTVVFETFFPERLDPDKRRLEIYTWGAGELTLPAGATSLALVGHHPNLRRGEVLLVAPTALSTAVIRPVITGQVVRLSRDPVTGLDPATGLAYTQIWWFEDDALKAPLPVRRPSVAPLPGAPRMPLVAIERIEPLAAVFGNLVLADQGRTVMELLPAVPLEEPLPASRTALRRGPSYSPELGRAGLTFRALADPTRLDRLPASAALIQDPRAVLPAVSLVEHPADCGPLADEATGTEGERWLPRPDLLETDRFAAAFVVEMTEERRARLRFGDGEHGRRPPAGSRFEAFYRIGSGPSGNVAAGSIARLVTVDTELARRVVAVSNPAPATGGRPWESLDNARLFAPTAFHTQRRCITREDYEQAALTHPEVLAAAARLRWSGRFNTAFLYLQRRAGKELDGSFLAEIEALFQPLLVADTGLALRPPEWVALSLAFTVSYLPTYDPRVVRHQLEDILSDRRLPDGGTGFFYPDNMRFGARVYASDLITRLSSVPGVVGVVVDRFERMDWQDSTSADRSLARGYLEIGGLEIAMLRQRSGNPELGTLSFTLEARR